MIMLKPESWIWYNSTLNNAVDGDTVDVTLSIQVDIGFRRTATVSGVQRVRLNRIDAYAINTDKGKAARQALLDAATGFPLTVTTLKPYKYGGPWQYGGEYMAEIVLPNGSNLSDLMVAGGYALAWDGNGPRPAKMLG